MTYESLISLLEILRDYAVIAGPIRSSGERYINLSCPFAKWRHEKGTDNTPSMTINFGPGETSWAHCFACGFNDTVSDMVAGLSALHPDRISHLISAVMEAEYNTLPPLSINAGKRDVDDHKDYTDVYEQTTKPLSPEAIEFLASKGCPQPVAERLKIRWVPTIRAEKANGEFYTIDNAVLFPVMSVIGRKVEIVGAQAREIHRRPTMPKYITAFRFKSGKFFYGDHLLRKIAGRRVFLVEGPLDAIHLLSIGEWALGLFGLSLSTYKVEKLQAAMPSAVYVLLDPDRYGEAARTRVLDVLNNAKLPAGLLISPKDPKQLSREDLAALIGGNAGWTSTS